MKNYSGLPVRRREVQVDISQTDNVDGLLVLRHRRVQQVVSDHQRQTVAHRRRPLHGRDRLRPHPYHVLRIMYGAHRRLGLAPAKTRDFEEFALSLPHEASEEFLEHSDRILRDLDASLEQVAQYGFGLLDGGIFMRIFDRVEQFPLDPHDDLAEELEEKLSHITKPINLSIIGCVVNGPGEALMTDVGFTGGGAGNGMIYWAGKQDHRIGNDAMVDHIVDLVEKRAKEIDAEKAQEAAD